MTAKRQKAAPSSPSESISSVFLVQALEGCWHRIRENHPEIPEAVIVLGSGSPTKPSESAKWGHFASMRWQHGDNRLPEVLVSGEGLTRSAADVLGTLLHEAAHALADVRDIQDTSRQGRWHNAKFATLAREVGLTVDKHDKFGWITGPLTDDAVSTYGVQLSVLEATLTLHRHPEPVRVKERTNSNNGLSAECACGRKIRISKTAYEIGPILCGVCDMPFTGEEPDNGGDDE